MDGSGNRLHSPDWQTIREHEISFGIRGIKENSYVATNGSVQESAQGEGLDIWAPALTGLNIAGVLTPGTTLLSIYNNDDVIVPGSNVYGDVALNRPMFIDEIGIRLMPIILSNYKDYRLSANVLWLNQAEDWASGTCEDYWMNNLNVGEGYGGGGADMGDVEFISVTSDGIQVGDTIVGSTSGASMLVTNIISYSHFEGVMADATDFALGENAMSGLIVCENCLAFTRTVGAFPPTNRLMWSPDRLYNAGVGPTEQPGIVPVGHGPNTFVAYADADGEAVAPACVRPLIPLITDSAESPGTFRPPKDSFILDPGQSIAIQVQGLYVPPAAQSYDPTPRIWETLAASGTYAIAAWIRFRQPLDYEPYDWDKVSVADKW